LGRQAVGRTEKRAGRQGQAGAGRGQDQVQQASAPLALYVYWQAYRACLARLPAYKYMQTTRPGKGSYRQPGMDYSGQGRVQGRVTGVQALHSPCQRSRSQAANLPHLLFCKTGFLQGLPWEQAIYVHRCATAQAQTGLLRMSPRCDLCLQEMGQGARHAETTEWLKRGASGKSGWAQQA
jgi:hypothetical protein